MPNNNSTLAASYTSTGCLGLSNVTGANSFANGMRMRNSTSPGPTDSVIFYGPGEQRLANWAGTLQYWTGFNFGCNAITYFAGQMVTSEGDKTASGNWGRATDWLGSTRTASYRYSQCNQGVAASSHLPYRQARTGGSMFASYLPNTTTSTVHATNREYSAVYGRFLTPSPYQASGGAADPGSWNRYRYSADDPVNFRDPRGFAQESTYYHGANAAYVYYYRLNIVVNSEGIFLLVGVGVGYSSRHSEDMAALRPASESAQQFILLHAAAHHFGTEDFIKNDGGKDNERSQAFNNDLLWDKCAKTIYGK